MVDSIVTPDGRDANNTVEAFVNKAPRQNSSIANTRIVRLSAKKGQEDQIYGTTGLMQPLKKTQGMVWPYQPDITWEQQVNYTSLDMIHTNQEFMSYVRSSAPKFTVNSQFTIQNQQDGLYCLACIHLMRTVTKMSFGASANAGTPPPVLDFNAFGTAMFNMLPVIVTAFSVSLPSDVDYIPIDLNNVPGWSGDASSSAAITPALNFDITSIATTLGGGNNLKSGADYTWLPAAFAFSVSMTVQNTPNRLRAFDLEKFRTGNLLKDGRWS